MRYGPVVRTRHTLALLLAACQPSPATATGFGSGPELASASTATVESSTSLGSSGTTTSSESGSGGGSAETMGEPVRDLGSMPDFGDSSPVGCQGKIDFLFMISRQQNMHDRQEQLALAFPQFIDTIKSKFGDFDYHIMVVTGDDGWGNEICDDVCPNLACKVGDPCCPWGDAKYKGWPCCPWPDYPCDELDLVTQCDRTWGAGEVFPAGGSGAANKQCPIDGGGRYLVKGQSDLEDTFECIAKVGASGDMMLGQALTAAVQKPINAPGGCNKGFLRDDALLMVTFIATNGDIKGWDSEGTPAEWAQAVIDAKHGDEKSVVMLNIGFVDCVNDDPNDRLCVVTKLFPFHHLESVDVVDYGPAFDQAASLVETACAGFTPPPT